MTVGVVTVWRHEEGWGVIESRDTPGGCWFFFSDLWGSERPQAAPGEILRAKNRTAVLGETVDFDWEATEQDGYSYRATDVRPRRPGPQWTVESNT